MTAFPQPSRRSPFLNSLIAIFLLAIAAVSVLPNYGTQQWSWRTPPDVPYLSQIKALQTQGLTLPGWQTLRQEKVEIGGHKWSIQEIRALPTPNSPLQSLPQPPLENPIIVMLRPQTWHRDQPQVDWMDINGVQQWTADSQRSLQFVVNASDLSDLVAESELPGSSHSSAQSVSINARFLRGWNQRQTYAVVQWYAWSTGGSAAPSRWFWVDQLSQWRDRHRMPWVAVSVLIPIKPLGDIDTAESLAKSLGQTIQSALMIHVFAPNS
jgi:cyanoexosortase B-associated protein